MAEKRLKKEDRKNLIQETAKLIFIQKGFKKTTMQDIVNATGMSIGGLYHHYRSTADILYDIMMNANSCREAIIEERIHSNKDTLTLELFFSVITEKILSDNDIIPLYVMFYKK